MRQLRLTLPRKVSTVRGNYQQIPCTERSDDLSKPLPPEEQQVWITAADYAHFFPFTAKWDELYDAFLPARDLGSLGEIDAAQMAQQICEVVDPILAQA